MKVFETPLYKYDIEYLANSPLPWDKLCNKSIMVSGATGLIGSMFIDTIMRKNYNGLNCKIIALGRNKERIIKRFSYCIEHPLFKYVLCDVNESIKFDSTLNVDYVIHLASNTHPIQYSTDPIGTILTNIIGLNNLLDFAVDNNVERFVFASSNEIYGENKGDIDRFDEKYCGYIDCNTLRAGYPESKRCGESLCQAYKNQKGLDVVIPRFTRSYGPTLINSDTKALSQFLHNGMHGRNIVLKSAGEQLYSFMYVMDCVSGLLTVLLKGINGEAYNIADKNSDIRLKDLALLVAHYAGTKVVFEEPENTEKLGYSKATKALLDPLKLQKLGWTAKYDIKEGIDRTLKIMKESR